MLGCGSLVRAPTPALRTCAVRRRWAALTRLGLALAFFLGALGATVQRGECKSEKCEGETEVERTLELAEGGESLAGSHASVRSPRGSEVQRSWPPRRVTVVRPPRHAPAPKAAPVQRRRPALRRSLPDDDDDDAMA